MRALKTIRQRLDFSTRVFIYLFASMLAVFAVYNFIFFQIHKKSQEDAIIRDGTLLSLLMAKSTRLALFTKDKRQLELIAGTIMPVEEISLIRVFNREGRLIYLSKNKRQIPNTFSASPKIGEKGVIPPGLTDVTQPIHFRVGNHLRFWTPVRATAFDNTGIFFDNELPDGPGRILGYISMDMDKSTGAREIRSFIIGEVIAALFFIVISGLLSFIIVRNATAPLNQLLKRVKDYSSDNKNSKDEFGILTRAYDDLIERLGQNFETIDEFNRVLEEQVTARTGALNQANIQMRQAMSDLKETQAQVIQAEKMAALGLLVAGVAHEINNTINFISGAIPPLEINLKSLKRHLGTDPGDEVTGICANLTALMENIREGTKRTSEIVRNLQDFSRPHPLEFSYTAPCRIIDATLNLMKPKIKGRIEITRKYNNPETAIQCYPGQLGQVFMNIIMNSVQAIEDKGRIMVTTGSDDNLYRIKIADDGPGIPPEIRSRIFDPFFTTKEVGHGTGLGLSVTYSIIKEHGGEIRINPSPFGHGCEFEIILPVSKDRLTAFHYRKSPAAKSMRFKKNDAIGRGKNSLC